MVLKMKEWGNWAYWVSTVDYRTKLNRFHAYGDYFDSVQMFSEA